MRLSPLEKMLARLLIYVVKREMLRDSDPQVVANRFERACNRAWFAWQAQYRPRRRSWIDWLFMSPVDVYGAMHTRANRPMSPDAWRVGLG